MTDMYEFGIAEGRRVWPSLVALGNDIAQHPELAWNEEVFVVVVVLFVSFFKSDKT